jgi:predicted PurR-regulated permease PerM
MMAREKRLVSPVTFRRIFLLVLAVGISYLFYLVVEPFLVSVLLAAIFAGMAYPFFEWLRKKLGGSHRAGLVTLLTIVLLGIIPAIAFVGVLANEALSVSESVAPWIERQLESPDPLFERVRGIPLIGQHLPDKDGILTKAAELTGRVGGLLVSGLASATMGTFHFFLQLFVMLYAMYFFLLKGQAALGRILYLSPLDSRDENRLVARFTSVTRATIKGSLVIGLIQGGLAGLGFWVAGIHGPIFWGTIMVVLSIIPAVGAALIWVPAVIYLFASGNVGAAIGLLAWCGIVVSSTDNFLRPMLVGRDTKMPDLLVLLSTLGGIALMGVVGFIIGPIVAALFLTVWEIYSETFQDFLPESEWAEEHPLPEDLEPEPVEPSSEEE